MTADHTLRISGIDPEIVIVAMWNGNLREGLSAINRLVAALVKYPERLGVLGIGIHVLVVPGTLAQVLFVRESLPGGAGIIGAEDSAVFGLDECPEAILSCARNSHTDLSQHASGQSFVVGDIGPGLPAVGRLVKTTALAAAIEGMGEASCAPESGVEHARIVGVQSDIVRADLLVKEQNVLPGLAAIAGAEDAALPIGAVSVSESGDVE